ncbi:succinylarginine dihydrolase [Escherichia coli MS 69-1]|nr:succinylarginine dihydrolase [Escherichia coli MS 69-1]
MNDWEVNFDGLVGLTHHYAGLSFGNEASTRHRFQVSNPRLAAKQGLLKMKTLADAGFPQAVIPPHERPFIPVLRQLGFSGSDEQVLEKVARQAPHWLSSVSSASPMWVANAATIAPSADTLDGKVHLTVANLNNKFHRSLEAPVTESLLKAIFNDEEKFSVHSALPQVALLGDEGRQTTIVSAVITVNRVCNFLSTGEKKAMIPGLPFIRRGRLAKPARRWQG